MADCQYCDVYHRRGAPECPGHRVGTVIADKYRIDGVLGIGGISAVYAAHHVGQDRPVALKVMHAAFARDAELAERFVREARELGALGHPGIVKVHDAGFGGTLSWIEMERLVGLDLYQLIEREGAMPPARAVAIAISMLDALAAAHARGVVHRDLKSANVFLATTAAGVEQVVLLDFGFAKVAGGDPLTQPGELLGSILYMSPEQYRDPSAVDHRTDLYAAGVILFECVTGRAPVTWNSKAELRRKVFTGEVERHPRAVRADVPEWLDAVVSRAMAFERDARFDSALAMQQALMHAG